jgi:uncharacterized tellurite resistance protein B-like protein
MARGLLARLREVFEGNASVRKVADDPALTAELLLLLRMVLADGDVAERELATLRRIADGYGVSGRDFELVLSHLEDFGYEVSVAQAIAVFRELDKERRLLLARHMADIAKADQELSRFEVRLLARVLDMLDLDPSEVTPELLGSYMTGAAVEQDTDGIPLPGAPSEAPVAADPDAEEEAR